VSRARVLLKPGDAMITQGVSQVEWSVSEPRKARDGSLVEVSGTPAPLCRYEPGVEAECHKRLTYSLEVNPDTAGGAK